MGQLMGLTIQVVDFLGGGGNESGSGGGILSKIPIIGKLLGGK